MGTAIYTGVTGLQTHQRRMDVVASNIANVNTTGYRGSRVLFQDLFSQTIEGARAPVGNFGGTNASQVGLGVQLASIDVNFNQGSPITTNVASDLAIDGSGFFVLSNGTSRMFTRDGSFSLNSNGALIDPATGLRVQGYMANDQGQIDTNVGISDLVIPVGGRSIVKATSLTGLQGNLNSEASVGDTVQQTLTIYDSLGTERQIQVTYTKRAQVTTGGNDYNAWDWSAAYTNGDTPPVTSNVGSGTLLFDATGGYAMEGTVAAGVFTQRGATAPEISLTNAQLGGVASLPTDPFTFNVDFSQISELADTSGVTLSSQDGFPRGVLSSYNIGTDGVINGVFSNGLTAVVGQVALANFANIGGLVREGDNLFRDTAASGVPQVGLPNTNGLGTVTGGVLEGSNVDLGTEFSNMIITQRGFQANARTITTADALLQETVNLVR